MVKKTQPQAQTCTGHKDNRGIIGQGVEVKVIKNRLLLHSCCGPCSTACVERLVPVYKVTIFFYNPNITDREEYEKRKQSQIDFIKKYNQKLPDEDKIEFIEGEYMPEEFYEAAQGLESEPEGGSRCTECFRLRLERTAQEMCIRDSIYSLSERELSILQNRQT